MLLVVLNSSIWLLLQYKRTKAVKSSIPVIAWIGDGVFETSKIVIVFIFDVRTESSKGPESWPNAISASSKLSSGT